MTVAVIGGDGRPMQGVDAGARRYASPGDGGNGELRRLEAALRAGSIDRMIILARWNSHSATRKLRRLCKRLRIEVEVWA
jgi:hypothetical protein